MADSDFTAKDFYVYVHKRASDGRVFYVGKGSGPRAWSKTRSKYWHRIVAKHGYTVEIVQSGMEEWWAFELERELIALYGRENLCNLTDGGDGASGAIRTQETKSKIGASKIGKPRPDMEGSNAIMYRPGVSAKVSAARKGILRPDMSGDKNPTCNPLIAAKVSAALKNVPKSDDHKKKLSDALKGKPRPDLVGKFNPHSIPIRCICTDTTFESMSLAVKWLKSIGKTKACDRMISKCCKKIKGFYTAYGYKWEFA